MSGRLNLNFNKLIFLKPKNDGDIIPSIDYFEEKFAKLRKYNLGSPDKPSSGYKDLKIQAQKELEENSKDRKLNDIKPSEEKTKTKLLTKSYIYEKYIDDDAIIDGETGPVKIRIRKSTDIFLLYPKFIAIRGSLKDSDKAFESLNKIFGKDLKLEFVPFPHDFFMWLICRLLNENTKGIIDAESDFKINRIEKDETQHSEESNKTSNIGNLTLVGGSDNASISPQTLTALAAGQEFSKVWISFTLNDFDIDVSLSKNRGVYIYSDQPQFKEEYDKRYAYSIMFLEKIIDLYSDWEAYSVEEKYPSEKCLKKMVTELQSQITSCLEDFEENVLDHYKSKKEEEKKKINK